MSLTVTRSYKRMHQKSQRSTYERCLRLECIQVPTGRARHSAEPDPLYMEVTCYETPPLAALSSHAVTPCPVPPCARTAPTPSVPMAAPRLPPPYRTSTPSAPCISGERKRMQIHVRARTRTHASHRRSIPAALGLLSSLLSGLATESHTLPRRREEGSVDGGMRGDTCR